MLEHTIGGVIGAGKPLLDLVPSDDKLIIEIRVNPVDIESVHPGLIAKIQLLAYKHRSTPWVNGKVIYVSADSFQDEKLGHAYYSARILIPSDNLKLLKDVKLYPGMPVEVMVITGKRTAMSYFMSPLLDSFNRAFRKK